MGDRLLPAFPLMRRAAWVAFAVALVSCAAAGPAAGERTRTGGHPAPAHHDGSEPAAHRGDRLREQGSRCEHGAALQRAILPIARRRIRHAHATLRDQASEPAELPRPHVRQHARGDQRLLDMPGRRREPGGSTRRRIDLVEGVHGVDAGGVFDGLGRGQVRDEAQPVHVLHRYPRRPRPVRQGRPVAPAHVGSGRRCPSHVRVDLAQPLPRHARLLDRDRRSIPQDVDRPRSRSALGTDGIIITLFDEGSTSAGCCHGRAAGGHIAGIISGPGAGAGVSISTRVDQYSILRLIEDAWGLDALGEAARAPLIEGWRAIGIDGGTP